MSSTALRFQRFIRGVSQQEISKETGLSQARISRIERNVASDTAKNAEARAKICEFFKVEEELLFPKGGSQ